MYPNIFVSEGFFENFDNEYKKIPQSNVYSVNLEDENKIKSISRIRDLLMASNIYSDISDKAVVKYHAKQFGTYNNLKDLIFHRIIKDSNFANGRKLVIRQQKSDCNKSGFCYFTNQDTSDCINESKQNGKIVLGKDFLKTPFYLENTFASESTDETIYQIEKSKHPCTGLVIIDRFLFQDDPGRSKKIPNLISFLNELITKELVNPFEVDIITQNDSKNQLFNSKFEEISKAFQNKLSLHIYAPSRLNQESDRYLITNYSIFSIGHPFDRDTNVSCGFYPSNESKDDIKASYKLWSEKVQLALDVIKNTPKSMGLIQTIWKSDDLVHTIFDGVGI
jgi:hypothetical protein